MTDTDYVELFEKFFVEHKDIDYIPSMGEKDFSNFMKFANRDLKPKSRYSVMKLAIRLIKTN